MTTIYEVKEPAPIILKGFERQNGIIVPKKMFFVKYNNYIGYLYLETGEKMVLPSIKLAVVEQLVDAIIKGKPYISGKKLMYKAGSEQFYVCNLFWNIPNWRKFIETNGRGFYRLKLFADSTFEDYIQQPTNDNCKIIKKTT